MSIAESPHHPGTRLAAGAAPEHPAELTAARLHEELQRAGYLTTPKVETVLHLMLALEKPLLVEGPAGSGKTEIAKVLAEILGTRLIRLQCYEGLDESKALYEWNYQKQLLRIQADRSQDLEWESVSQHIFSREYLLERPLLQALGATHRVVLLIDEVDKSDEEFEAFLLEFLSDFQVSVPELGTVHARCRPAIVLTSNRTRELSEALKRRCLYLYLDFPGVEVEGEIVGLKVPDLDARLREQVARFVAQLRKLDLRKLPSVAETLDWARALVVLGIRELDSAGVRKTINLLLKHDDDLRKADGKITSLLAAATRHQH